MNEYVISKTYYKTILQNIHKKGGKATYKDVLEYLNKTANIKGGICKIKLSE